mmetsp:Transcript_56401/g.168803  ORF Transcript_56401/g.168803 Transcript_56401/m.168803 type:complete len:478 (-) Transcript_56401:677-2110(-)
MTVGNDDNDESEVGTLDACCLALRSVLNPPSCPICANRLPRLGYLLPGLNTSYGESLGGSNDSGADVAAYNSAYDRPCCRQPVCRSCVHSHITSVLSEGITGGGGRTRLTCPMGCGAEITDFEIRCSMKAVNWSWMHATLGALLFRILVICGLLRQRDMTAKSNRRYRAWNYLTKCHDERVELRTYERWSIAVALMNREEGQEDHVMRCPATDCDCIWFSSSSFRRRKMENERRYDGSSSSGGRASRSLTGLASQSLLRVASTWLFYRPLRPEEELGGSSGNSPHGGGSHRVIDNWVDAEHVDAFAFETQFRGSGSGRGYNEVSRVSRRDRRDVRVGNATSDGRRVLCPRCKHAFCGLCSRPWNTFADASGNGRGRSKRVSHTGKLCSAYAQRTIDPSDDDFALVADAVDARACPGCSMRTERIDGCNHMTCSCGTEWCYVCETEWSIRHYACRDVGVDGNGATLRGEEEEGYCVVS